MLAVLAEAVPQLQSEGRCRNRRIPAATMTKPACLVLPAKLPGQHLDEHMQTTLGSFGLPSVGMPKFFITFIPSQCLFCRLFPLVRHEMLPKMPDPRHHCYYSCHRLRLMNAECGAILHSHSSVTSVSRHGVTGIDTENGSFDPTEPFDFGALSSSFGALPGAACILAWPTP